ncbi:MAG: hypothetical protein RR606_03640, partial [Oscillospiraceae bacterium]
NGRTAQAMATVQYLQDNQTGVATYYANIDENHNMTISTTKAGAEFTITFTATGIGSVAVGEGT